MSDLNSYINDLILLEENLNSIIVKAILDNEGLILSKLKLRLFNKGVDGTGKKIKPEYTEITIKKKKQNNQRTSHVTLRDTGNYYASFFIDFNLFNNDVFINSFDYKHEKLIEKYGPDILGLTKDEQEFIILTIIEPAVQKKLNKINNRNINL